jgi:hypothetical protein
VLALLAGPLDARHWGARAFTRMAYNSGSTALVAAAGVSVFVVAGDRFGDGWQATVVVALLAAIPYFVAESLLGVVLARLLGERARDAMRHQVPLNALAIPLAAFGASAGLAWLGVGWWAGFALLLPVPVAPELVVTVRRRSHVDLLLASGTGLLVATVFLPTAELRAAMGTAALVCLAVAETRPTVPVWRRPLLWLPAAFVVAALSPGMGGPIAAVLVGTAVGLAGVALLASDRSALLWCASAVVFVACVGRMAETSGPAGVLAVGMACALLLLMAAQWGPMPWPSRVVGPFASHHGHGRRALLVVAAAGALACSVIATLASGTVQIAAGLTSVALLEAVLFACASSVRFWRLSPSGRRRDAITVTACAAVGVLAVLPLATAGRPIAVVVTTGCVLVALTRLPRRRSAPHASEELDVAHRE